LARKATKQSFGVEHGGLNLSEREKKAVLGKQGKSAKGRRKHRKEEIGGNAVAGGGNLARTGKKTDPKVFRNTYQGKTGLIELIITSAALNRCEKKILGEVQRNSRGRDQLGGHRS